MGQTYFKGRFHVLAPSWSPYVFELGMGVFEVGAGGMQPKALAWVK
jgi:hypothetical protein